MNEKAAVPADIDLRVEVERLQQFRFQSGRTIVGTMFPALAIWIYCYVTTGSRLALIWAVMIHAWQLRRMWQYKAQISGPPVTPATKVQVERRGMIQVGLFAVIWGLSPWMLLERDNYAQMAIVMFALMGMMSGAMPSLSMSMRCGLIFLLTLGGMQAAWMIWQGDLTHFLLSISICMYTVTLIMYFRTQHQTIITLLHSRFENEALAHTLAENQKRLEQLHQERSQFFAAASHDLRQPLQALTLYSHLLARDLGQSPHHATVGKLGAATQAIGESLDVLLDLHQLESGVGSRRADVFSASELMITTRNLWTDVARGKDLQLRFRTLDVYMCAPRQSVMRILSNLVDNALKYTVEGGVLVAMRRVRKDGRLLDVVRLEVWDTGIGIAEQDQGKVFQEFFQADNPERERSKGLGIGLAAVQRICQQLGFALGLRSRPGRDRCFIVSCRWPRRHKWPRCPSLKVLATPKARDGPLPLCALMLRAAGHCKF